ncbi:MAG: hypothetical protein Crog4KO_35010 [Crocinitomicaceae bacterium]
MANFYPATTQELIDAINSANNNGQNNNTIHLTGGVYEFNTYEYSHPGVSNLRYALPIVTSNLTIRGNNSIFQRSTFAPDFGYMHVDAIAKIKLEKITFKDGKTLAGVALLIYDAETEINDCKFLSNSVIAGGGGSGAGLTISGSSALRLSNCVFKNNSGAQGGALSIVSVTSATINNCTFEANANAAIYVSRSDVKIQRSKFKNNTPYQGSVIIDRTNTSLDEPINAQYNDWGDPSGPSGAGSGSGDAISNGIVYKPFTGVANPPKHKGDKVQGKDCSVSHASKGSKTTNNPISLDDGEKRLEETDIQVNTPLGVLAFTRRYRQSQQDTQDYMGLGWTHNHIYSLVENGGSPNEIIVTMGGSILVFEDDNADDIFEASAGSTSVIVKTVSGYDLTASDESVYHFDTAGKLMTHTLNNDEVWTYSYDGNGNLTQVTDGYGRALKFAYYTGTSSYKDGQLWRVGTHQSLDLINSPQSPYVELDYTDDGNGEALLTDVQDVRGGNWTYRYYGSQAGETDTKWLNFLVERFSPVVDRDGDNIADTAITLESLTYNGTARDEITNIVQNRGENLINRTLAFDPANDVTTETVEGIILTHNFTNGVYLGTEDNENNSQEQVPLSNYRPAYQQDAKGNATLMLWSDDGKRLESVMDAQDNETSFTYDSQDRLTSSTDAEGRVTNYVYEGSRRQPSQILVADTIANELVINGDMEDSLGWSDVGTPTISQQSQTEVSDGDNSWYVDGATGEGIQSTADISFDADTSYLITARVYVVGTGEQIKVSITNNSNWDVTSSEDGEWETLRTIHTPSSALSEKLQFLAEGGSAEFYIDSVHVVELTNLQRWQQFVYDDKGRTLEEHLLNHEDATVSQSTVRTYGESGNEHGFLRTIVQKNVEEEGLGEVTTTYYYDEQGRVIKTAKNSLMGTCKFTYTVYDAAGKVLGTACSGHNPTAIPTSTADLTALLLVDEYARVTLYKYDEMGRRVETTSNAGTNWARTSRTIYDALSRVTRTIQNYVDETSAQVAYTAPGTWSWDGTKWIDAAGVPIEIEHGDTLDENIISDTEYNGRGLVNMRRDVLGRVTLYGYNTADRLVKTVQNATKIPFDGDDEINSTEYDMRYVTGGDPALIAYSPSSNADEDIITEQVYDPNGNVVKSIDARGSVTYTAYDELNRPAKVISNASKVDPNYNILTDLSLENYGNYSTDPDKDMVSITDYNAMGRVVQSKRLLENRGVSEEWDTTYYVYDSLGRQVRTIQHYVEPLSGLTPDSWVYEDEDGVPETPEFIWKDEADGNAIDHGNNDSNLITETVYDNQGRVKETLDVNRRVTSMVYDGLNRQVMTIANYVNPKIDPEVDDTLTYKEPDSWVWENDQWKDEPSGDEILHGDNDQNIISQTVYDSDGRVESTRNVEGLVSRNAYDGVGRSLLRVQNYVEQATTPDNWGWTSGEWQDGGSVTIDRGDNYDQNIISKPDYDDEQRVFQTRDARGNLSRQVYDEAGRTVMSIANYVEQVDGSGNPVPAETWYWDNAWKGVADVSNTIVEIDHGTKKDQNRISTSEFDLLGRAYRTRDVAGRESYTVYDAVGRVVRRIQNYVEQGTSIPDEWLWTNGRYEDGAGTAIDHGIDNDQNIISETVYNQAGQVVSSRDAFGTESSFVYDSAGRRLQVIQASNTDLATASYTCFDKAGRVLRSIANYKDTGASPDIWDIDGNWAFQAENHGKYRDSNIISEMVYDRASRRVSSVNAVGDVSQTTYFKDGQVDSMTDPEGMVTVYRYDALRRRKMVVQSYVANGDNPENWVWNNTKYTESDDLTDIIHGTENDQNIIVMINYDIAGRMKTMRDPRGNLTAYEYDKLGRRTRLDNPLPNIHWDTSYTEVDGAQETTMTYPGINGGTSYDVVREFDRFGRLQGIDYDDDSNTAKVDFEYDILGNRLSMSENDGTSDIRITGYSYDQRNRLTGVDFDTDGDTVVDESVSYDYDMRGLRTKLTMDGNLSIAYSYDAKGRLIGLNDWDNQDSQFNYDALNRHIGTVRPNGMRSVYRLDEVGRLRELRHENKKRQTLAMFRYAVDKRGNRVQAQELSLPANASATAQVILHENPDILYTGNWTDTSSFHESTEWDAKMALVFVGDTNVELLIGQGPDHSIFDIYVDGTLYESVDGYATVASSRTVSIDLKGDAWHGLEIRNRHEKNMQSSGYTVRFASLSVDTALTANVIDYSYDSLSRLIEADYNNGATVYNYGYDVAGNMVDCDGVTRTYNAANQMTNDGTNTLVYDNNGNLRTVGSDTYTWDRANRLSSVGNHSYVYDGLGNRVQQTVSSVVTYYLNDLQPGLTKLLKQDDDTNVEHFVHAPRGIHAVDDGTDWNFYAQDGLGSVRAVVDDAAVVQTSMSFDPYGNPMASYGAGFGFTGEQTDENGGVFLRARYYEPELGVFSALDPWEGKSCTPMSLNGYSWVEGNPIMNIDPSGEQLCSTECEILKSQAGIPQSVVQQLCGGDTRPANTDDTNPSTQMPFVIPQGGSLPDWITTQASRICDELCNRNHDDNVFQHLNGHCQQESQSICDWLCMNRPIDPDINRIQGHDYGHKGLFTRWMEYYIDPLGARGTHQTPYQWVREQFNRVMGDINGWGFDCKDSTVPVLREFESVAQGWRDRELEAPPRLNFEPDLIPECTPQQRFIGGALIVVGGLLILSPIPGDELIPVFGAGVVAPCLFSN